MLLALLLGCAAAWRPDRPGPFELVIPPGWALTRNYRFLGSENVVLERGDAAISLTRRPEHGPAGRLPLDLVAGVRALSWGRRLGVENAVLAEHDLLIDGRRAAAVTGLRRWRTARIGYTMLVTRTPGHTVEIVLHAPGDSLDGYAADWGAFLDGFHLAASPEADGPLFEEDGWRR
jgi:hypothetical protein